METPNLAEFWPRDPAFDASILIRAGGRVNPPAAAPHEFSTGPFAAPARPVFRPEPCSWYVEERWVSAALFDEEAFGPCVIDPCAGLGNVVASARACGLSAYGSDVIKRAQNIAGGHDFLSERWRPRRSTGAFAIVGNPPWGGRANLLRAFAEAACERAEKVALLAPAHRLAAAGAWLARLPLKRVLHITPRPAMWPGPIYVQKLAAGEALKNGHQDFAWLIFERGFRGAPKTAWLKRPSLA